MRSCRFDGKVTADTSSAISCSFINCGAVDTGAASDGVEMLNSSFIDPDGVTDNYGITFAQTPAIGSLIHKVKQTSLITSGTPTTQYMVHFPAANDYSLAFADIQFFGNYTSGTLWHGINTGTDADVTVNSTGSTNAVQAEFSSTDVTGDTGSVVVSASVGINFEVLDKDSNPIANARVTAYLTTTDAEVINLETNESGIVGTTFSGSTPVGLYYRIRKSSAGDTPKYVHDSGVGTIESGTGFSVTRTLRVDPNNNS